MYPAKLTQVPPPQGGYGHTTHVLLFGQRQNQTKRGNMCVEHEGQLQRSNTKSLSHFGGYCFAKINAFFVWVSADIASEAHLIVYPYFCPPTEVQSNFYELFLAL